MYISRYFSLSELVKSQTARINGIDNTPTFNAVFNLSNLCRLILDPAREKYGKPIRVTSGYRCTALNIAVGGVGISQHGLGCAVDLQCDDMETLFDILASNSNVDQLLFEHSKKGTKWLHVSFSTSDRPRRMIRRNYKA